MEQANQQVERITLVLGTTGGIGGEVVHRLVVRGWYVWALQCNPDALTNRNAAFEQIRGNAMAREDAVGAAQSAELIIHAVNPSDYQNWAGLVLPMVDNTIAAARVSGMHVVSPGTVYNFVPDTFPVLRGTTAQAPLTCKGKIRAELEHRMQAASADGIRGLIVRVGDFSGLQTGSTWFAGALVKPGKPVRTVTQPGAAGIDHQRVYPPDMAETMLHLVEQGDRLPDLVAYHMRGHWDANGTQMAAAIGRVAGRPVETRAFPWWLMPALAPFSEMLREMHEMRYLR